MSKTWLRAASIRALKTVAQSTAAVLSTTAVITEVNWQVVLSTAILSGMLSILTSIAGLPEVQDE